MRDVAAFVVVVSDSINSFVISTFCCVCKMKAMNRSIGANKTNVISVSPTIQAQRFLSLRFNYNFFFSSSSQMSSI